MLSKQRTKSETTTNYKQMASSLASFVVVVVAFLFRRRLSRPLIVRLATCPLSFSVSRFEHSADSQVGAHKSIGCLVWSAAGAGCAKATAELRANALTLLVGVGVGIVVVVVIE